MKLSEIMDVIKLVPADLLKPVLFKIITEFFENADISANIKYAIDKLIEAAKEKE